jgi:hypothetical protein
MRRAIIAGWIVTGVVLLGLVVRDGRAQASWPEDPSDDAPFRPECGNPPPEMEDPSPGDGNDCWEYTESDGWARLFNCIYTTNCPAATATGGQQGDCACLNIDPRENKRISINGPYWDVQAGSVVVQPDIAGCGDPDTTPIDPVENPWWEAESDDPSVAIVSPEMGVGHNADFTVYAATDPGGCNIQITWNLGLEMDGITTCPTNISQAGPTVDTTVFVVTTDFPETGDCPEMARVEFSTQGFGKTPEPTLLFTLEPLLLCENSSDCERWRITGGAYLELGQGWYRTHNKVMADNCPQPKGTLVLRSIAAVARTVAHELKHCEKAREDVADINNTIVGSAVMTIYSSRNECRREINELKVKIQREWKKRWGRNESHCYHVGDPKI